MGGKKKGEGKEGRGRKEEGGKGGKRGVEEGKGKKGREGRRRKEGGGGREGKGEEERRGRGEEGGKEGGESARLLDTVADKIASNCITSVSHHMHMIDRFTKYNMYDCWQSGYAKVTCLGSVLDCI